MSGTLAPPPRYGREDESILLDAGRQAPGGQPKYVSVGRGHSRGQSWVSASVGGSNARTQTMQSDISLASLPNHSPPGYDSFSSGEEAEQEDQNDTPVASTDTVPLIERREE